MLAFVILQVALLIWSVFWFTFCSSFKSIPRRSRLRSQKAHMELVTVSFGAEHRPRQVLLNPVVSYTFLQVYPGGEGQNVEWGFLKGGVEIR